ncbi:MAG TPA: hypothetical protein VH063_15865 [Gaiellaceae bacterium]|nr:hypothetical protein [Gaiellaceae bacterium]
MPTFRLLSETGEDLGTFRAATPTWTPGDRIHQGHSSLVVVAVTVAEDGDDVDGCLVVKPA